MKTIQGWHTRLARLERRHQLRVKKINADYAKMRLLILAIVILPPLLSMLMAGCGPIKKANNYLIPDCSKGFTITPTGDGNYLADPCGRKAL